MAKIASQTRGYVCRSRPRRRTRSGTLKLDNQVFSNLLIFILRLIAKINDLRGVDVKTVRIHQKT